MAASRITVEIGGSSASLQEAVAKAAEALKSLGNVVKRETESARIAGDATARANAMAAASFEGLARKAGLASERTIRAFERQGAVVLEGARAQTGALARTGEAATVSAREQTIAGERSVRAQEMQAQAARLSAEQQVRANDLAAASAARKAASDERSATRSKAAFGSTSSALTRAGRNIALGLAGAAAASVDLAVKFQANTLRMQTQAGATTAQLGKLRAGILAMAGQVGYSPNKLADAMYHVVSSMNAVLPPAQRVTTELRVLRVAAEGAQIGHSDLEQTTYALASAMNALHAPASQTEHIMGTLNAIVGAGDLTMQQLVDSLSTGVLPAARGAGVSLQSLGAAMAVMGDMGQQGAIVGTRLRMSIALLASPSEAAAKILQTLGMNAHEATSTSKAMADALQKAGLRTTSLSADLRQPNGLMVALRDLNHHLMASGLTATGAAAVMNRAFGGGKMGATIVELAQNTDRLNTKFQQIGSSANQFGSDWKKQGQTTAQQLHNMEAGALALGTRIGTSLLPYVEKAIHGLSDFVGWLQKGSFSAHLLEGTVGMLATVAIGSYLVSSLMKAIRLIREFGSLAARPMSIGPRIGAATRPGMAGALGQAAGGMGIGGIRSPGLAPGTRTNPIVTVVEAGDVAGLGSYSASGSSTTEQRAVQSEKDALANGAPAVATAEKAAGSAPVVATVEKGAGGVASVVSTVEKPASRVAPVAAEALGGVGLLGSLKGGLGSVLSGLKGFAGRALGGVMKGGMIAALGDMASQLVGSVIGGKTGKKVAAVGTDVAMGAGAGMIFGPAGAAVGAAGGAAYGLLKQFDPKLFASIKGAAGDAFNWIKGAGVSAFDWLKGAASTVAGAMSTAFHAVKGAAVDAFDWIKNAAHDVGHAFSTAFDAVKGAFNDVVGKVGAFLSKIGNAIANSEVGKAAVHLADAVSGLWDAIVARVGQAGGDIALRFSGAFKSIWSVVGPIVKFIGDHIGDALNWIKGAIVTIAEFIGDRIGSRLHAAASAISGAFDTVKSVLTWLAGAFDTVAVKSGVLSTAWDAVKRIAVTAFHGIEDAVTGFLDVLSGVFEMVTAVISGKWGKLWQGVKDILRGALKILDGIAQTIGAPFIAAFNMIGPPVAHAISSVVSTVVRFLSSLPGKALHFLGEVAQSFVSSYGSLFNAAWKLGEKVVSAVTGWLASLPGKVLHFLGRVGQSFVDSYASLFNAAWTLGKQVVSAVADWLSSLPGKALHFLGQVGQSFVSSYGNLFSAAWGLGKKIVDGIVGWVKGIPGTVVGWIRQAGQKLGSLAGELFNDAWKLAQNIVKGLASGIKNIPGDLLHGIENLGKSLLHHLTSPFSSTDFHSLGQRVVLSIASGMQDGGLPAAINKALVGPMQTALVSVQTAAGGMRDAVATTTGQAFTSGSQNFQRLETTLTQHAQTGAQNVQVNFDYMRDRVSGDTQRAAASGQTNFQQLQTALTQHSQQGAQNVQVNFDYLRGRVQSDTQQAAQTTQTQFTSISNQLGQHSQQGAQTVQVNFDYLKRRIGGDMSSAAQAVALGIGNISTNLRVALHGFGATNIPVVSVTPAPNVMAATGGFVGSPGERGRDTIIAHVGAGEAIANAPQQDHINTAMSFAHAAGVVPYGSLPELFAGTSNTRHYMYASGGFASESATRSDTTRNDSRDSSRSTSTTSTATRERHSMTERFAAGGVTPRISRDALPVVLGRGEPAPSHKSLVNTTSLSQVFAAGAKHYASGGFAGYSLPLPRSEMMPGRWSYDQGVDIPAPAGTPEFAIGPGQIVREGIGGFGPNAPILRVTAGPLTGTEFYYGHAGPDLVRTGQAVRAGQQISEVGAGIVGISSGPHIEFGVWPPVGGRRVAQLLSQLMGGAGVTGIPGMAATISEPVVHGKGEPADIARAALKLATTAANQKVVSELGSAGVTGSPVSGTGTPGNVAQWLTQAMSLTGVSGPVWLPMLERQAMRESGGNPNAVNNTDINARMHNPSEGLLQTTLSTFASYALPGHTNIFNPVDNAAAAIRYMIAQYGHGNPNVAAQVMWARGGGAYAHGGIVPEPVAMAAGGIVGAGSRARGTMRPEPARLAPPGHADGSAASPTLAGIAAPAAASDMTHGGIVGEQMMARGGFPGKVIRPPSHKPKAPKAPHYKPAVHALTPKELSELAQIAGTVNTNWTAIQRLGAQYSSLQSRYSAEEAEPQYTGPDGSSNKAGIKKKWNDDYNLLYMQKQILADYRHLLAPVSNALARFMGMQSSYGKGIGQVQTHIDANKRTIAADHVREATIRKAILDLEKPQPDAVVAIEDQIAQLKLNYDPAILAAKDSLTSYRSHRDLRENTLRQNVLSAEAKAGPHADFSGRWLEQQILNDETAVYNYGGANTTVLKGLRSKLHAAQVRYHQYVLGHPKVGTPALRSARLAYGQYLAASEPGLQARTDALAGARESEQYAILPLSQALLTEREGQQQRKYHIKQQTHAFREQLASLAKKDARLAAGDVGLGQEISGLRRKLSGQAGALGTNEAVQTLEQIAQQLGMPVFARDGVFERIDTTNEGGAFDTETVIIGLQNDMAQLGQAGSQSTDNSQLLALYQQQNLVLAEELALNESQTSALISMIPEIPRYDKGGPIMRDTLAMVHEGEHVVPKHGALVMRDSGPSPAPSVHIHVHGDAQGLIKTIRSEIDHPRTARHISHQVGQRTSMLSGAPGGWR